MMNRSAYVLCLLLLALSPVDSAWTAVTGVRVETPKRVLVGDPFIVQITVSTDGDPPPAPRIPTLPGITLTPDPSRQSEGAVQIGNQITLQKTYIYSAQVAREGTFEITGIEAGGQAAPPVTVLAVSPQRAAAASRANDPLILAEATIDKLEVWQGEQVTLDYFVLIKGAPRIEAAGIANLDVLTPFQPKEQPVNRQSREAEIEGRPYTRIHGWRFSLFPIEPGDKLIPPLRLKGQVPVRQQSFFGTSVSLEEVNDGPVLSDPIEFRVKPLPTEGRPADFSGAVGSAYTLVADLQKRDVSVGEPFTLSIRIRGSGNIAAIAEPKLNFPEFIEVYDTERTADTSFDQGKMIGEVRYNYVLIARKDGNVVLDPITFTYFSTGDGRYVTQKKGPFALKVKPDEGTGAIYIQGKRKRIRVTGEDFRHIHATDPFVRDEGRSLLTTVPFWLVMLGPWGLVFATTARRKWSDHLKNNPELARRLKARDATKGRLAHATKLAEAGGLTFFSELENVLHEALSARLGISTRGVTRSQLEEALAQGENNPIGKKSKGRGIEASCRVKVIEILDTLDRVRFAPGSVGTESRQEMLEAVRNLVKEIQRG